MRRTLFTLAAMAATLLVTACGGPGGGAASTSVVPPPTVQNGKATATVTFRIPRPATSSTTASAVRHPQYVSPATNNLTVLVDGEVAFDQVTVPANYGPGNPTYTAPDGSTATLSGTLSPAYYTWVLTVTTRPGSHHFGAIVTACSDAKKDTAGNAISCTSPVVGIVGTPSNVLSEGDTGALTLKPGSTVASTLYLKGVVGSAYITCPSSFFVSGWQTNNPTTCGGYTNFDAASNSYSFVAVAADTNGFPIPQQMAGSNALGFDNGTVSVSEDPADTTPLLSITPADSLPYSDPGGALADGPSGSWYTNGSYTYGHAITVQCVHQGSANIVVTLAGGGGPNAAMDVDTANFPASQFRYPAAGQLPVGFQDTYMLGYVSTSNPSGTNPNFVPQTMPVNCSSTLQLTVL